VPGQPVDPSDEPGEHEDDGRPVTSCPGCQEGPKERGCSGVEQSEVEVVRQDYGSGTSGFLIRGEEAHVPPEQTERDRDDVVE
jgi:hypothetical protein